MSMETLVFGAIRPASGSFDERGKWVKREPEPEPESESEFESESESEAEAESESESEVKLEEDPFWWKSIPIEELKESDFASRYEDDPGTFCFACPQFVYKNKAQRKEEEETKNALAAYLKNTENISPFDAIPIPRAAMVCGNNFPRPLPITEDRLPLFIQLSKLALENYNLDNQGTNTKYEFLELVKVTRRPSPFCGNYYITFKATPKPKGANHVDPSNYPATTTTFQANVWNNKPEPEVKSCSIKPQPEVKSCSIKPT